MTGEVLLTRTRSVAEVIERLIRASTTSVDAALYRFNSPRLARVLQEARQRGVQLRLVLDRGKYEETRTTRELLSRSSLAFRLMRGQQGL